MMTLKTFESYDKLKQSLITLLIDNIKSPNSIMLSGGKTPYETYNEIAKLKPKIHKKCKLFLSDERYVPYDSKDNNAYNLSNMLSKLQCHDNFIAVNTSLEVNLASIDYGEKMNLLPPTKIGLLGIGEDGHTAGIFSKKDALSLDKKLAFVTVRPNKMLGISVSNYFIQNIEKIILIAVSNAKTQILEVLFNDPSSIPAGIILNEHQNVEVWTDVKLDINSNKL